MLSSILASLSFGHIVAALGGGAIVAIVPKIKSVFTSVESKLATARAKVVALEAKIKAKL